MRARTEKFIARSTRKIHSTVAASVIFKISNLIFSSISKRYNINKNIIYILENPTKSRPRQNKGGKILETFRDRYRSETSRYLCIRFHYLFFVYSVETSMFYLKKKKKIFSLGNSHQRQKQLYIFTNIFKIVCLQSWSYIILFIRVWRRKLHEGYETNWGDNVRRT